MRIVLDTNVLVSALRSQRGASFQLLQQLGTLLFRPIISPPLCLEYEDVLRRPGLIPGVTEQDIGDFWTTSFPSVWNAGFISYGGLICRIRKMI